VGRHGDPVPGVLTVGVEQGTVAALITRFRLLMDNIIVLIF
jgi:hypothetical protein